MTSPGTPSSDEETGLPVLRRWREVYAFVLIAFALMVILLSLFSKAFS